MSRFSLCAAVLLLGALGGCKPVAVVVESLFQGSLRGLDACMEANASSFLDREDVRAICVSKHQQPMTPRELEHLQGVARSQGRTMTATISSTFSDRIISQVNLMVYRYDEAGEVATARSNASTWLLPGERVEVSAELMDLSTEDQALGWCDDALAFDARRSCKTWDIFYARAISF
ncbi:hypothetical protein [Pseudooceanicola sp. 200-1SW]|uniref:hypothetical protein n=1 Tax=Pseudooceanicola sp. 200-1SW TaxID=3425949 RepID=UPI003D7F6DA3